MERERRREREDEEEEGRDVGSYIFFHRGTPRCTKETLADEGTGWMSWPSLGLGLLLLPRFLGSDMLTSLFLLLTKGPKCLLDI